MRSYGQYCSVAKALDVVGDRWTLLVARELILQGPCRYTDLLHGLPGIATNLLSTRLRELEDAGLVRRRAAPPPVATTLYELTDDGRELEPVVRALGHFGARYMTRPTGGERFRTHWLSFPVAEFLEDLRPEEPVQRIEVRIGDESTVVEIGDGAIRTVPGPPATADLLLQGEAPVVLGVLNGLLDADEARTLGLRTEGSTAVLERLRSRFAG